MNLALLIRGAAGAVAGGAVGYAMYRFVGCRTGACPLTGNPWVSVAIWALFGLLFASGPRQAP
jgi:hypothetical protein